MCLCIRLDVLWSVWGWRSCDCICFISWSWSLSTHRKEQNPFFPSYPVAASTSTCLYTEHPAPQGASQSVLHCPAHRQMFEGEGTLIGIPREMLDERDALSPKTEVYADGVSSYIKGGHVVWGLAVTFILIKNGTRSQCLLWSHSSTKWWQGKRKSSLSPFNLFIPLSLC